MARAVRRGLFFLAPLGLTGLFRHWLGTGWTFWLVEGLVRVAIFIVYLAAHDAHPATCVACSSTTAPSTWPSTPSSTASELTVRPASKYRTLHLRCGTSFLLVVMVVSIFVFALVRWPVWYCSSSAASC